MYREETVSQKQYHILQSLDRDKTGRITFLETIICDSSMYGPGHGVAQKVAYAVYYCGNGVIDGIIMFPLLQLLIFYSVPIIARSWLAVDKAIE